MLKTIQMTRSVLPDCQISFVVMYESSGTACPVCHSFLDLEKTIQTERRRQSNAFALVTDGWPARFRSSDFVELRRWPAV